VFVSSNFYIIKPYCKNRNYLALPYKKFKYIVFSFINLSELFLIKNIPQQIIINSLHPQKF
jgi:hypothetical protein